MTIRGTYPREASCNTSRGMSGGVTSENGPTVVQCHNNPFLDNYWEIDWGGLGQRPLILTDLVYNENFLKRLPVDSKNNSVYYYRYEPSSDMGRGCDYADGILGNNNTPCTRYWVGVRLESIEDPSKIGKMVFRCSDDTSLAAGVGCKVVEFPCGFGDDFTCTLIQSFDGNLYTF